MPQWCNNMCWYVEFIFRIKPTCKNLRLVKSMLNVIDSNRKIQTSGDEEVYLWFCFVGITNTDTTSCANLSSFVENTCESACIVQFTTIEVRWWRRLRWLWRGRYIGGVYDGAVMESAATVAGDGVLRVLGVLGGLGAWVIWCLA